MGKKVSVVKPPVDDHGQAPAVAGEIRSFVCVLMSLLCLSVLVVLIFMIWSGQWIVVLSMSLRFRLLLTVLVCLCGVVVR